MKKSFFSLSLLVFLVGVDSVSAATPSMPRKTTTLLGAVAVASHFAEKYNAVTYLPQEALEAAQALCTFLGLKPNDFLSFARSTAGAALLAPSAPAAGDNTWSNFSNERQQVVHNAVATFGVALALKKTHLLKNVDPVDASAWVGLITAGHYQLPGVSVTGIAAANGARAFADGILTRVGDLAEKIRLSETHINNTTNNGLPAAAAPATPKF